jgi:esterase/lipase superfamily enzyme
MSYPRRYLRFASRVLGREMEMLHFGHRGYPLICLPTSNGRFFDLEDRGIIASLGHHLEQGYLQAFCVETLDWETLFNRELDVPQRRDRWLLLEQHWVEELIPYAKAEAQNDFLVVAGFSLGATHAVNLTCRHPGLVRRCLALGGGPTMWRPSAPSPAGIPNRRNRSCISSTPWPTCPT